ncbi:MAG: DUF4340 domain-containing protein [Myxococcota bacterium]
MNKATVAAIAVFVVLLGVVLAMREEKVSVGMQHLEVPKIEKDQVVGLEISGASSATLKKEGAGWLVADPKSPHAQFPVEDSQLTTALDALGSFKAPDLVTDQDKRHAELEVDDAKGLKLKVLGDKGALLELVFGKAARSGGTYVRRAGQNAVFATPSGLPWNIRKDVNGWRKRSLFSAKLDEITSLSVRHADGASFTAHAGEGGQWKLAEGTTTPPGFRFDAAAPGRIAQQLVSLSAHDFLSSSVDESLLGLSSPAVVEVKLKDGRTVAVKLGRESDPQESSSIHPLQSQFDAVDADKDGKLTLAELEKAATGGASEDLKKACTRAKTPEAFARLDVGVYAHTPKDGAVTKDDLTGGGRTAGMTPVQLEGDAQVYLVPGYASQALRKRLADLRDHSLLAFDPEKVTQLVIAAAGRRTVVKKAGETWNLIEPKTPPAGFELDPARVSTQLTSLKNLRATRVAEGVVPAKAGLAKPSLTVEVTTDDGKRQALKFGAEADAPSGGKELFAQGAVDAFVYALPPYEKTRLEPGVELFKKLPPPDFGNMGHIKGLEQLPPDVRAKLEAQLRQNQ